MSQNDARALLIRYAAGELDAASEAQAQVALADPALRRFYAEVLMQQVLLGQLASERRLAAELAPAPTASARRASGSGRRPLSLRRSRIRPRRSAPWFAVAAALVLFAGAALIFTGPHARPPLPDAGQAPPTVADNRPAGRGVHGGRARVPARYRAVPVQSPRSSPRRPVPRTGKIPS